ncbi:Cytochrome [Forsythia ovata]|uniref:Cytochrome n=1 Tax=Forsythia ovata TaxID=205694 RepID=A0ABD1TQ31_9LAMI
MCLLLWTETFLVTCEESKPNANCGFPTKAVEEPQQELRKLTKSYNIAAISTKASRNWKSSPAWRLGLFPHRSLQALSKRYGPFMMIHLGRVPAVIVSSADAAREIMKNQDVIFSNRPKLSIIAKLFTCSFYGEYWRQVRSLCVLQLLSNKRVQSFHRIREEDMSRMILKIRHLCSSASYINLSDILVTLTNDIICRVALGRKYSDAEESTKFESMLKELAELLGTFNPGDYIPWLNWIKGVNGFEARVENLA